MKEDKNKKTAVRITEGNPDEVSEMIQMSLQNKLEKLKKPIIFLLMGVVFLGSMYLIFKPDADKNKIEKMGLNDVVPQASETGLQSDKQKAYEAEMLELKNQEKRNALTTLSDYWNTDEKSEEKPALSEEEESTNYVQNSSHRNNRTLNSFRNAKSTLGSFYQEDNYENKQLRKQMEELREQLAKKDEVAPDPVKTQLQLMEKSYQMAAKYFPTNIQKPDMNSVGSETKPVSTVSQQREYFTAFTPLRESSVSKLYQEPSDSTFIAIGSENINSGFHTMGTTKQTTNLRNSIKACVQETQKIIGETTVQLRLLEPAQTPNRTIPQETVLIANAKLQNGRLQLKVTSIELEGNIIPVDILIYDLDGQQGLSVPYSSEKNALNEMMGNMSQTSGTSLMMTNSAEQQIAADLSRGVIQGVSGYLSKKVKTPKVILKAGHQLLLVSKK